MRGAKQDRRPNQSHTEQLRSDGGCSGLGFVAVVNTMTKNNVGRKGYWLTGCIII